MSRDGAGVEAATAAPAEAGEPAWGPWDATDEVPEAERLDFGSLQVPVAEGSRSSSTSPRTRAR